jgi:hypothetical protein
MFNEGISTREILPQIIELKLGGGFYRYQTEYEEVTAIRDEEIGKLTSEQCTNNNIYMQYLSHIIFGIGHK